MKKSKSLIEILPFLLAVLTLITLMIMPMAMKSQTDSCKIRGCYSFSNLDNQQIYGALKQLKSAVKSTSIANTPSVIVTGTPNVNVVNTPSVVVTGTPTVIQYDKGLKYEFEWSAGTTTYSVTNAVVIGTLSVNAFSVALPSGYYKLSYVLLGDFTTSNSSGYNLWLYDSIPQSQTDNVAISNNQNYTKRNLIYSIALTSQIINDSGRLFYNGSAGGYGQTYTSEYLFSGTIYYILTVAGGTPYANSGSVKNLRLQFKKVAEP